MGTSGVVGALQKEGRGRPFRVNAQRRLETILFVVAVSIWLGAMGFAIWMLWQAWTTAAWDEFWISVLSILPAFFLIWRARDTDWKEQASLREGARALRWAAITGDDRFAPRISEQAGGQPEEGTSIGPWEVRITNPWVALQWVLIVLLLLIGLMGIAMAGLGLWGGYLLVTTPPSRDPTSGWGPAIGVGIALVALLIGGAVAWLPIHFLPEAWSELRGQRFRVDDWGIWHIAGRRQRDNRGVAWHEARTFYRIEERPFADLDAAFLQRMETYSPRLRESVHKASQPSSTTYFLDTGTGLVTWTLTRRAKREDIAEHGRLCWLITTRTRLPLRDVTDQAIAVSKAAASAKKDTPLRVAVVTAYLDGGGAPLLPTLSKGSPRWRKVVTLGPIVSVLLMCGGGWSLQHLQTWQYSGLVPRIHAEKPLLYDPLTHDDGLWPVHPATSEDASYSFDHAAYMIADGGGEAQIGQTYRNVAVEVTVRQLPASDSETMGDLHGAGLTLRETDNPYGVVTFTIGPLGDWFLMRYREWGPDASQWQVLAFGEHSRSVHWGLGVRNQLLVDMRGSQYICFVNGQLVAAVADSALTGGQVGVWVDDNSTAGLFNDFTVYPAA